MISSHALRAVTVSLLLLATADRAAGAGPDSLGAGPLPPVIVAWPLAPADSGSVVLLLSDGPLPQPVLLVPPPNHTLRSVGALAGAGVAVFGVIWMMPEEVSKWDKTAGPEGFRPGWSAFKQAYTRPPVWDEDGWVVNYVAHPVVGMQTYLLERNYGASPTRAFLFSTAASVGWEYLIESWAERPSAQDLLVTSTVGSLLGEASYRATQQLRRGGLSPREKVVLTIINPVHVLQHGYR